PPTGSRASGPTRVRTSTFTSRPATRSPSAAPIRNRRRGNRQRQPGAPGHLIMRTILVTGAAGFIGSNFVRMLLSRKDAAAAKLIAFDKLTYAGNLANLQDLLDAHGERITFVKGDIADEDMVSAVWKEHGITEVVNFAAESHVDRSILGSGPF